MGITLTDIRRIAEDVAQEHDPPLDVVGVTTRQGSSGSAEVIFGVRECEAEPCRFVISVNRRGSEAECRSAVRTRLREHLDAARSIETTDGKGLTPRRQRHRI